MAEAVSNGRKVPPTKRRRILDASTVAPVQIYSNQVSSRLLLKLPAPLFDHQKDPDPGPSSQTPAAVVSDSDEEEPQTTSLQTTSREPAVLHCPSPPAESPVHKQSSRGRKTLIEINRRLQAIISSPPLQTRARAGRRQTRPSPAGDDDEDEDDDVIMFGSDVRSRREIPLKIRCRTDVHKIPVLPTTPLSDVIGRLSVILKVPAARLLLLRKEEELPAESNMAALGLGIADIIDCVVMATAEEDGGNSITVRLQANDRDAQDFNLRTDAALSSVFSKYVSSLPAGLRKNVRFHLDGSRVSGSDTPAQLDLEDGDIIEVWT